MPECSSCNRVFWNEQALHAHCRDKEDHAYCVGCERLFAHHTALQQHLQNAAIHRDSDDENENESEEEFDDDNEPAFCDTCGRWFVDRKGLYQHLATSSRHNWCFVCSRDFTSPAALQQHSSSRVHKSRDLYCPLCTKAFAIPSAIALHIESGACHNITRHQVTAAVHSMKIVPTISILRRLEGATPANRRVITYTATERAFNGTAYECYLCHRKFKTLNYLNSHLNSAAHDADEFKCPKCKKPFKLISGLIQHIESEVCGAVRFKQVEDYATNLTSQFSRLLKL